MTYLITANIERIEATEFFVANIYGDDGQLIDQIIKKFENYPEIVDLLREEMYVLLQPHFEVWTSNSKLFGHLITVPGIAAQIKHRDQTQDTKRAIEQVNGIMRDLYEIVPAVKLPSLPKWRRWIYEVMTKITNFIGGKGKYEI